MYSYYVFDPKLNFINLDLAILVFSCLSYFCFLSVHVVGP